MSEILCALEYLHGKIIKNLFIFRKKYYLQRFEVRKYND